MTLIEEGSLPDMTRKPEINPYDYTVEYWKRDSSLEKIMSAPLKLGKLNDDVADFRKYYGHRPRVLFGVEHDLFDFGIPLQWRHAAMIDIANANQIDAMIQTRTKHITGVMSGIPHDWVKVWPSHVGLILTITDQADYDIFRLLMLKWELNIPWIGLNIDPMTCYINLQPGMFDARKLDWVMAGGADKTGSVSRLWPHYIQTLQQHCAKYNISFFFKGWGDMDENGKQVGSWKSGRVLDGRTWEEFPEYFDRD